MSSTYFILFYFIHANYVNKYDEQNNKNKKNLEDKEREYEGYLQLGGNFYMIVLYSLKIFV